MKRLTVLALLSILFALPMSADTTAHGWRGDGTGYFSGAKPPLSWSATENIRWSTDIGKFSNSQPILLDGRLYVNADIDHLVCLESDSGKILWDHATTAADLLSDAEREARKKLREEFDKIIAERDALQQELNALKKKARQTPDDPILAAERDAMAEQVKELSAKAKPLKDLKRPSAHGTNGYSSPTPTTDGKRIYVVYGTGVVAAFTPAGDRVWGRVVEKPTAGWGHSASPLLAGGKLIIAVRNVTALDPATGKTLWECKSSAHWGSPVATKIGDVDVIITTQGQVIRADNGEALKHKLPKLEYNSPLIHDGVFYAFNNNKAYAYRLPATIDGELEKLWEVQVKTDRYYASPVLHEGIVYCLTRSSTMTALKAGSGEKLWEQKLALGGTAYPSPTFAGGSLFVSSDHGVTLVLEPGAVYKEIGKNTGEKFRSSPVFAGDRIYLRGLKKMVCIDAN